MASNWGHYKMWTDPTGAYIWIQHRHPDCMETESFAWPTFQEIADWVQTHECGAQE